MDRCGRSGPASASPSRIILEEITTLLRELASGDDERAQAVVTRLAACGLPALAPIRALLSDPVADTRWWAIRTLAEIKDSQVPLLFIEALKDEDAGVRHCATLALCKQPDPRAVDALITALASPDRLYARLAADALSAIGEPAVQALIAELQNGPQPSRLESVRALAAIRDTNSIPALFSVLDDDSAVIEYWANEGLERMGVGMAFFKPG